MLIGVRIVGSITERFSRSTSNISARNLHLAHADTSSSVDVVILMNKYSS
jgi:hypothetical protein